jgi:hypothetical protein
MSWSKEEYYNELLNDHWNEVMDDRDRARAEMRSIVKRWQRLRKAGEHIEDAREAWAMIQNLRTRIAACDQWLKENE